MMAKETTQKFMTHGLSESAATMISKEIIEASKTSDGLNDYFQIADPGSMPKQEVYIAVHFQCEKASTKCSKPTDILQD